MIEDAGVCVFLKNEKKVIAWQFFVTFTCDFEIIRDLQLWVLKKTRLESPGDVLVDGISASVFSPIFSCEKLLCLRFR